VFGEADIRNVDDRTAPDQAVATRGLLSLRTRSASLVLGVVLLVLVALLGGFAIELSNSQSKARNDVTGRVHDRAVLAAALLDSLFQTTQQQLPTYERLYGTRTISTASVNQGAARSPYVAVLSSDGAVLAASRGFTAQARADLKSSAALRLVRSGDPYGLGDRLPYGKTGVVNFAVRFPTPYGTRILMSGILPSTLSPFVTGELRRIPGVKGSHNYLLDANHVVLASTNPQLKPGSVLNSQSALEALAHPSGVSDGHYYLQAPLSNSTLRVLLSSPTGALFASVNGLHKWIPWVIFVMFGLVALAALGLAVRAVRSAADAHEAKQRLELANTDLAELNDSLKRHADELARSNSELEQFASIASHDLQEPLRKVRTFTQQLTVMEGEHISEKGRAYLERTNAAAERMQQLIEDLLTFSRVSTRGRPFEPVDLTAVTTGVVGDLEAQIERTGATVHIGELPIISADPLQMRQLMQNLISNALKFRREDVAPKVSVEATIVEHRARIAVHDNGIGFEPQYGSRIFRIFERLHGRTEYPGTGIGLALCRKIVERHGGTIYAEGEPGIGSTFTVMLPLRHSDEPPRFLGRHQTSEREVEHAAI
jgi:signal transduction histidine kinase